MRRLGPTIANLAGLRRRWEAAVAETGARTSAPATEARQGGTALAEVTGFGSNPGRLRMFVHRPARLEPRPALVVALHGCTQTAADHAWSAGWTQLADERGFVVVAPEQHKANNARLCFNWFVPGHIARDQGEALSIRQMVARAVADHGVDPSRVFVTGLSAGGAMTAVMLAAYPDVFAGGAIMAGLPYGAAANVQEALQTMSSAGARPPAAWGEQVRRASPHRGPWPRVSIWHGEADHVVTSGNARELAKQWTDVHGLDGRDAHREDHGSVSRLSWAGPDGSTLVETWMVPGMGHGTPVAPDQPAGGSAGPFFLDVGVPASRHVAAFWGLADPVAVRSGAGEASRSAKTGLGGTDPASVIARALSQAGILRR